MDRKKLIDIIKERQSYLCIGLDTDNEKLPVHLKGKENSIFEFNKAIIDATRQFCVSYKINTAFYEAEGAEGWKAMQETVSYIGEDHFRIADAKRGDIGNTSEQYAKAFFHKLPFDAITVAPYMGRDSVKPFLQYNGKWGIVLGLTSNPGAEDFELQPAGNQRLYEKVMEKVSGWGSIENTMFVVGATQASEFGTIRQLLPDHFLLVPGVGAQGGSLADISRMAMNRNCGLLVNISRTIIYASNGPDFAEKAAQAAAAVQHEMQGYLSSNI